MTVKTPRSEELDDYLTLDTESRHLHSSSVPVNETSSRWKLMAKESQVNGGCPTATYVRCRTRRPHRMPRVHDLTRAQYGYDQSPIIIGPKQYKLREIRYQAHLR